MESALQAKFAKEGEVTILRKRMEKVHGTLSRINSTINVMFLQIAQDHSAQVAKLQSAKEEADAKRVLLQKQFEADRERLKTELTFKVRNTYIVG